jgi:hypothetical protein
MKEFKVGDTVRIHKASRYHRRNETSNPIDTNGVITHDDDTGYLNIKVKWSNGKQNSYSNCDLELVTDSIDDYQIISRSDVREIYYAVCSKWREEIEKLVKSHDIFEDTIKVPRKTLIKAYKEAGVSQTELLDKYFSRPKEDNRTVAKDLKVGEMMIVSETGSIHDSHVLLRHYTGVVSLTDPNKTWGKECGLLGIKLETGYKFEITAK